MERHPDFVPIPVTCTEMVKMYRVVFPRGYRPQVCFACEHCTTLALGRIAAASSSPAERPNSAYACDLRYDGCKRPEGIKRH